MTKEEILAKRIVTFPEDEVMQDEPIKRNVYKAMQEYADYQSAEKDTQIKDLHQQLSSLKASMDILVDDNEMLSKRVKELEFGLGMLVALKTHKDAYGKDREYEEQQPLAWEQARKLLNVGI